MTKETNGKGNNILRDEWETPQLLFDILNKQYHFEFDCCATSNNKKCSLFTTSFENYPEIIYTAWMNPPFSKAYKMFEHFVKVIHKGVGIYRCDNFETGIWQRIIIPNTDWIFIPDKRINYEGLDGNAARFPSALIGIGLEPPNSLEGRTLREIK